MRLNKDQISICHSVLCDFLQGDKDEVSWADIVVRIKFLLIKNKMPPVSNWVRVRDILACYINQGKMKRYPNLHLEIYEKA